MAPPCWMTPAQRAVVLPLFTDYSHYQATKKLHKFWPLVHEAWFHAFPEEAQLGVDKATATVVQLDALQRATEKRKAVCCDDSLHSVNKPLTGATSAITDLVSQPKGQIGTRIRTYDHSINNPHQPSLHWQNQAQT